MHNSHQHQPENLSAGERQLKMPDGKNAEIKNLFQPSHTITTISPSMKVIQYRASMNYLPLIVDKLNRGNNKHWKFLLHLAHLVDLIFFPRFT
jgi:hypothetical protein